MSSEFVKNNPTVLCHCVLYEVLQNNVKTAATNVLKKLGKNAIDFGQLENISHQFFKEKFFLDNQLIGNSELFELFRNDKKFVRACIFYNVMNDGKPKAIHYKEVEYERFYAHGIGRPYKPLFDPVFDLYKKMCKVIGDDVIEYPEFTFWYYRFANGEFDMDYERDKNEKMLTLEDMPIDIIQEVAEKLTFYNRSILRKVSKSLCYSMDNIKSGISTLFLDFSSNCVSFSFEKFSHHPFTYIGFDYCKVHSEFFTRKIEKVKYMDLAIHDLGLIFKSPNFKLKSLNVHCRGIASYRLSPNPISDLFKSFNIGIQVERLCMDVEDVKLAMSILPYLKPGVLKTIKFETMFSTQVTLEEMAEIMKSDQWKKAIYFKTKHQLLLPIENLFHFKRFQAMRQGVTFEEFMKIKNTLLKSPIFEGCILDSSRPYVVDVDAIKTELGQAVFNRPDTYHYPIPNSEEYFEIKLSERSIKITRK